MISKFKPNEVSAPELIDPIRKLGSNIKACELGVCRGLTLRYFLDNVPEIDYVYAIDPWLPYQDWNGFITKAHIDSFKNDALNNLLEYDNKVKVLEMTSQSALAHVADNELDFIFIDGAHDYESVLYDCSNWWQKVRHGGLFSGHDFQLDGVRRAVLEFRQNNNVETPLQFCHENVWFWYKQ